MTNKINNNPISVRICMDLLFASIDEFDRFQASNTMVRTVYVESDNGELSKLDVESFEVDEVKEIDEDCE